MVTESYTGILLRGSVWTAKILKISNGKWFPGYAKKGKKNSLPTFQKPGFLNGEKYVDHHDTKVKEIEWYLCGREMSVSQCRLNFNIFTRVPKIFGDWKMGASRDPRTDMVIQEHLLRNCKVCRYFKFLINIFQC